MMNAMRMLLITMVSLVLGGCATMIPSNYSGPDAGYLVFGFGAAPGTTYSAYKFMIRKKGENSETAISYLQDNLFWSTERDFDDQTENGYVAVRSLPQGDYEIYNFEIHLNGGMIQTDYGSRNDFSIPFKVTAGKAVYIGDFTAVKLTGRNIFGMSVHAGAYFLVSDKSGRDLPIARRKVPTLPEVQMSVPDPATIDSPFFQPKRR